MPRLLVPLVAEEEPRNRASAGLWERPRLPSRRTRSLTYERQRQQLLDQLAVAEEARRMAMEELEELERSQTREGVEVSGGTSAASVAN